MTPNENMSVLKSTGSPRTCSGDIYARAPRGISVSAKSTPDPHERALPRFAISVKRDMQQSESNTVGSLLLRIHTLAGFNPRWAAPVRCTASRAEAMATEIEKALGQETG